jgi:hypothetical protein
VGAGDEGVDELGHARRRRGGEELGVVLERDVGAEDV